MGTRDIIVVSDVLQKAQGEELPRVSLSYFCRNADVVRDGTTVPKKINVMLLKSC